MDPSKAAAAYLTPEWLTEMLRKDGCISQSRVVAVEAEGFGAEIGFLDSLFRVKLTYDRTQGDAPSSLVVKASSAEAIYQQIGNFYDAYKREFKFYETVAPEAPIRLPRCYGREVLPDTGAHLLLLEDLCSLSAGNQVAGLSPPEARVAVETIGRLHAHWWNAPALDSLSWMPKRNMHAERYQAAWPEFRELFSAELPREAIKLGEYLGDQFEDLLTQLERSQRTIVHADFRADNLLFDETTDTPSAVVVDWQLAIRSHGILDVARLLCGSMVSRARAESEMALLKRWHEVLEAGGVAGYSFAQAARDYRTAALIGLYYPVTIHAAEEAAGKRGAALAQVQIERCFAAALHWNKAV